MDGTSTPNADACTTKVTSLSFDRPMADLQMQLTSDKLEQLDNYFLNRLNARLRQR